MKVLIKEKEKKTSKINNKQYATENIFNIKVIREHSMLDFPKNYV